MSNKVRVLMIVGTAVLCFGVAEPTTAAADPPPLPPTQPFLPGAPVLPYPGAYSYQFTVPYLLPAGAVDTRGVNTGTNADPAQAAAGLPGSRLGPTAGKPSQITATSARYGISGGVTPANPPTSGVSVTGGVTLASMESANGQPAPTPAIPEASAPARLLPSFLEGADGHPMGEH